MLKVENTVRFQRKLSSERVIRASAICERAQKQPKSALLSRTTLGSTSELKRRLSTIILGILKHL
ncbi:hypothetical protein BFS05_04500 [Gardnerella vaginalis]|uniref:Uncharacterized protein n=1 Tax=Gardnerella vaginalis TaxID=2702 RepID=A0A2K1SUV0_GARVA|nr:hypothetical protein BFS05_04500 [Gardnerella vaginalis]